MAVETGSLSTEQIKVSPSTCLSNSRRQPLPLPRWHLLENPRLRRPHCGARRAALCGQPRWEALHCLKVFMNIYAWLADYKQNTWGMSSRANLSGSSPRGLDLVDLGSSLGICTLTNYLEWCRASSERLCVWRATQQECLDCVAPLSSAVDFCAMSLYVTNILNCLFISQMLVLFISW